MKNPTLKKPMPKTTKKSISTEDQPTHELASETERLTEEDLRGLRTHVKAGIVGRCCEYFN